MFIALIGYGKMGKEIEAVLVRKGHKISFKNFTAHQKEKKTQGL